VTAEHERLAAADAGTEPWRAWGTYVAERAWGTVREDYSEGGTAWESFPHDHARSRAYRWNEDGIAGWCDGAQRLCLATAFWNGEDPILKERFFGLTGNQGNHGEDVKEYWWHLDGTPTHSWNRLRYHYPQRAFPYGQLVAENERRGRSDLEYELLDTGVFDDDRYWRIEVTIAKSAPDAAVITIRATNEGPDRATLHVLPTAWFRNTWSWGGPEARQPVLAWADGAVHADHPDLGAYVLRGHGDHEPLFCDNETNARRLWGTDGAPFPKDGINDHVVSGAATVNPARVGTKAALWYRLDVAAGETAEVRVWFGAEALATEPTVGPAAAAPGNDGVLDARRREADDFYASVIPAGTGDEDRTIARQAFAGLCWSKQWYHLDVARWLDGDPGQPVPPAARRQGRNHPWRHLNNADVLLMPDPWEYPWYAAWDLAFHCVAYAHVDPTFAKQQLILLCREWYMHPNGQLPAYEWAFGDVNPPVHAWAAMQVFAIDGRTDHGFLARVFHKLLLNFTWWVNRKDAEGNNVFEGGFLGLDNVGPIDRSAAIPAGGVLEQSDGSAWMAKFCLDLLEMSTTLAMVDRAYEDVATKFFEHFVLIATAMNSKGLWDEEDGFYYDQLLLADGTRIPLRAHSMVGLIPLLAVTVLDPEVRATLPGFAARMDWFLKHEPDAASVVAHTFETGRLDRSLLSIVDPTRFARICTELFDGTRFLSDHGIRSLSREHATRPFVFTLEGDTHRLDYEPAESTSGLFGGNSNWRGPVWFPVNHLVIQALRSYRRYVGAELTVEVPTGSGRRLDLDQAADELSERLIGLFRRRADGTRPCHGEVERFRTDPRWGGDLQFHEYFHGDLGAGLGASHQTGWTALVADLIVRQAVRAMPDTGPARQEAT
jgi:hypothetical protein